MIKIEITDPHLMDKQALQETAKYLMGLSGGVLVFPDYPQQIGRVNRAQQPLNIDEEVPEEQDATEIPEEPVADDDTQFKKDLAQYGAGKPHKVIIDEAPVVQEEPAPVLSAAEVFARIRTAASVELDVQGMPWDRRIHSGAKTRTKDGCWKKLRGTSETMIKTVEDELKTVQNIPVPPVASDVPASPASPVEKTFADFMTLITSAITAGKLTRQQAVDALQPFGIPSIAVVATRPDLIPSVMQAMEKAINETF